MASWKTHRKMGKSWENPQENGKIMGKPWENHGKTIGKWTLPSGYVKIAMENGLNMVNIQQSVATSIIPNKPF